MECEKEINQQAATHAAKWMLSDKPDWMPSTSVCVINVLILRGADDHALKISHVELGVLCGCSADTAKRAVKPLVEHKWVTQASSPWSAHEFTLTAEYLKHLKVKVEVTQDAKDFASWFHGIQKKNLTEVKPKIRKSVGAKSYEFRDHNNAARILSRVGGLSGAKSMVTFALSCPTFRRKSLQGLYNLKAVFNTQSFKDQFAHGVIPVHEEETPQQKMTSLLTVLKDEKEKRKSRRRRMNMLTGSAKTKAELAVTEQDTITEQANDTAAWQAMTMGMNPSSSNFPEEIEHPLRYLTQFAQMQKAKAQAGGQQ